jgi:pilus assembly protein Flp/PilA
MSLVQQFWIDDDGATAIEYGLIAAMIAVALIAAFTLFGQSLLGLFGFVRDRSVNAMNANAI